MRRREVRRAVRRMADRRPLRRSGRPSPPACARANMTRFLAHVRAHAPAVRRRLGRSVALRLVGEAARGVLAGGLAILRGRCGRAARGRARGTRWSSGSTAWRLPTRCSGRAGSSARGSTSPRTSCAMTATRDALVFWNERGPPAAAEPPRASARGRRGRAPRSRALGVGAGDRVAGFLPNLPETVIAMLAAGESRRDLVVVLAGLRRATACSTGSARFGPSCSSAPTAIATRARRSTFGSRGCARSGSGSPDIEHVVVVPYLRRAARSRRHRRRATRGTSSLDRIAAAATPTFDAAAVRPPALHHVLVGHDRTSRSAWCTARAGRCSST